MQYYFFAFVNDNEVPHIANIATDDLAYFEDHVLSYFMPISPDDYVNSLVAILQTAARFSYVLAGDVLYWCIEWAPGFIVVKFSQAKQLEWTVLRSPVPNFGGRKALPEDEARYDEEADNPQYNLIFRPWDAQFDAQHREWIKARPASGEERQRFANCLKYAESLTVPEPQDRDENRAWFQACKDKIETMAGEGRRV